MDTWVPALLALAPFVVFALWDAAHQADERWAAIGQSKSGWMMAMTVGWLVAGLGFIAVLWYLVSTRQKLEKADSEKALRTRPL